MQKPHACDMRLKSFTHLAWCVLCYHLCGFLADVVKVVGMAGVFGSLEPYMFSIFVLDHYEDGVGQLSAGRDVNKATVQFDLVAKVVHRVVNVPDGLGELGNVCFHCRCCYGLLSVLQS